MNAATKQQIVSDSYHSPVMDTLKVQIPLAILCFLMLDGGYMAKLCGIALAAHWVGILLAMYRRPFTPTNADLRFIRWGFLGLFVPLLILQGALW